MRRITAAALTLVSWAAAGQAQEPQRQPAPDLDFLEYLGAWAEDDDEWLAIEEWQKDESATPDEDRERSESREDDDDESN